MCQMGKTSIRSLSAFTNAKISSMSLACGMGLPPSLRDAVFKKFRGLEMPNCPFVNLPQRDKGRWGEGLTAEKMVECQWLRPRLVAQIEYAEWTDGNHLRHSKL